jgi:cyanophycinase
MVKHFFVAVLLLAACVAPPDVAAPRPGALLAVGGGELPPALAARALELAGGPEARLLILPQASERPEAGAESLAFWRAQGAQDARVLDLADPARARAEIAAADLLWIGGGDQNRFMEALGAAGTIESVRARWRAGAVVGGTSAGAAVLSGAMIVGGETADLTGVRAGGTALAEGLGLWPGTIVDQHFFERQRFNRLLAAVLDRPTLVGVGIGESTAVIVHADGRCEVLGAGSVMVLDAREAATRSVEPAALRTARGITLDLHRDGDRFIMPHGKHPPSQLAHE